VVGVENRGVENGLDGKALLTSKALAGYLETASGRSLVFAVFVNNVPLDASGTKVSDATAAAGVTTLELCASGAPQEAAAETAMQHEDGWRATLHRRGVAGRVWRLASIIHMALEDPAEQATLAGRIRAEGVDLLHASAFCSVAHSEEDIELTVAALDRALTRG